MTAPPKPRDSKKPTAPRHELDGPLVSFREEVAGRATLEAIADDRPTRARAVTQHYPDRISNAPGALSPKVARALDTTPEITVSMAPLGRETRVALLEEFDNDGPAIEVDGVPHSLPSLASLRIERVTTFVIDAPLDVFESEVARQMLLRQRLLPHLPVSDLRAVTRYDITPSKDDSTLLVRVWCLLP